MAVNSGDYVFSTTDTYRGPSQGLWATAPIVAVQENPMLGTYFWEDFTEFPTGLAPAGTERFHGKWTTFLDSNGLIGTTADTTNLPLEGGVLGITAGANNNKSLTFVAGQSAYRFITGASGFPLVQGKMWYETSIAVGSVASGAFDLFMGLMDTGDAGTRITSAADLVFSSANTIKTTTSMGGCFGFWKRATTNPANVALVYNVNNGTAQLPGAAATWNKLDLNYGAAASLAAMTTSNGVPTGFRKFGFLYDPNPPVKTVATALGTQTAGTSVRPLISVFVDGVNTGLFLANTEVSASTFASTFLAPVMGFRSGATGIAAGVAYVDWVRCLQLGTR